MCVFGQSRAAHVPILKPKGCANGSGSASTKEPRGEFQRMMLAFFPLFSRLRDLPALVKKWLRMKPRVEEFAPQRVCPFCGLITPRSKRNCLECGKTFKPAYTSRRNGQPGRHSVVIVTPSTPPR